MNIYDDLDMASAEMFSASQGTSVGHRLGTAPLFCSVYGKRFKIPGKKKIESPLVVCLEIQSCAEAISALLTAPISPEVSPFRDGL